MEGNSNLAKHGFYLLPDFEENRNYNYISMK